MGNLFYFPQSLLYAFSRPARKDATNRNLLRQKLYCLHLQEQESKSKRENGETPSLFKENYPPPRTCRSLIGCSPLAELSSRGRQSTWSGKQPWHMRRLFVYHLEHRMSALSCNGKCEGGSPHVCISINTLILCLLTYRLDSTQPAKDSELSATL